MVRQRFDLRLDAGRPMLAATEFTYGGQDYAKGDSFPIEGLDARRVSTLHGARRIDFAAARGDDAAPAEQPVKVEHVGGGMYQITAPWLAEPIRLKGKDKAEAEAQRIGEEGAPLGFIEGGSAVTVEEVGGGWFAVNAPWLDEPERVQGRAEAEQRQRELHAAGEPETHGGVTLKEGDGGWWTITRPEFDGELKVQGEQAAREAAAKLRAGEMVDGQPIEWTTEPLKVGDIVRVAHEGSALDGQTGTLDAIDGDQARVVSFKDSAEEGKTQEFVEDTVPLASLTLAPAETDGENATGEPKPDEKPAEEGEQT